MATPTRYNIALIRTDMDARGLQPADIARGLGVAPSTIGRFLAGTHQTAKTAKKIAYALGFTTPRRYVITEGRS